MSEKLNDIRLKIDDINFQILKLLNERTKQVREIKDLKDEKRQDYFDCSREEEMIEMVLKNNDGLLPNECVKEIFINIFQATLRYMGLNKEQELLISRNKVEQFHSIQSMFDISDSTPIIIAGPCAIENRKYLEEVAELLVKNKVRFMRGGAFKPRTSPYDFQGLGEKGLKMLYEVGKKYNLFTVAEIVDPRDIEKFKEYVDIIQIGARNMQNYELLKEVGRMDKPVLLKRGMNAKIQELMYAAEYIALQGNRKLIVCERGIRTFETKTRNTLDISSIPIIKKETKLPIIADLSHSLGRKDIVNSIAKGVLATGADGIMVELHPYPEKALSDSKQQLNQKEFNDFMSVINGFKG